LIDVGYVRWRETVYALTKKSNSRVDRSSSLCFRATHSSQRRHVTSVPRWRRDRATSLQTAGQTDSILRR